MDTFLANGERERCISSMFVDKETGYYLIKPTTGLGTYLMASQKSKEKDSTSWVFNPDIVDHQVQFFQVDCYSPRKAPLM